MSSKAKVRNSEIRQPLSPAADAAFDQALSEPAVTLKATLKRNLRPVARVLFRLVKPFVRPFAFRLRAYLLGALQTETQQFHQRIAQDLETSRQSQLAAMDRLLTIHTTHVLQEIQGVRESLRRSQHAPAASAPAKQAQALAQLATQLDRLEQLAQSSAHRLAVPCGPDALLLRTSVGPVLCPASDYALVSFLLEAGELERGTRLLIEKLLGAGDTFIDAGANIGLHTLAAARAVGQKGRIVAFEPFPQTHDLLRKSVWMNGFASTIETHQAAVSNGASSSQVLFLGATSGHHSLYPLPSSPISTAPPLEVPLLRIDDVIDRSLKVDLIKVDVEGAELEAVEGAAETIARNPHIGLIVEFGLSHLRRAGHSTDEWLQRFQRMGLTYSIIDAETGALREGSVAELESSFSVNLFFARPGSSAWQRARETS